MNYTRKYLAIIKLSQKFGEEKVTIADLCITTMETFLVKCTKNKYTEKPILLYYFS